MHDMRFIVFLLADSVTHWQSPSLPGPSAIKTDRAESPRVISKTHFLKRSHGEGLRNIP